VLLVWPVFRGAVNIHRLRDGSLSVVADCNEARLSAIGTAQIYAFRYRAESPHYLIEAVPPANPDSLPDFSKLDEEPSAGDLRPNRSIDWENEGQTLPEGVVFVTVENRSDEQGDVMLNDLMPGELEAPQKPLLFYPDGTTTNATIILQNQAGYYVEVVLDGKAGTVTASEPHPTVAVGGDRLPE
jgi:hypothetical protein